MRFKKDETTAHMRKHLRKKLAIRRHKKWVGMSEDISPKCVNIRKNS